MTFWKLLIHIVNTSEVIFKSHIKSLEFFLITKQLYSDKMGGMVEVQALVTLSKTSPSCKAETSNAPVQASELLNMCSLFYSFLMSTIC